jgi:hypothetical protein
MQGIADGALETAGAEIGRGDEIGRMAAAVQERNPPQSWPTSTASGSPSERITPVTSSARLAGSYPRGVRSLPPTPRRSIATARNPASASAVSWCRQVHQNWGKPCSIRTSGPSPCSATWNRVPFAVTARCDHGPSG